jgi:hypothetical protein
VFDPDPKRQQFCLDCWKSIDAGDAPSVQQGNQGLFQREQLFTISGGYAKLTQLLGVPTVMSFLANRPHPWGQNFTTFFNMGFALPPWGEDPASKTWGVSDFMPTSAVWSHSVTADADRWTWMSRNIYPTWVSVTEAKRKAMVETSLEDLAAGEKQWPKGL